MGVDMINVVVHKIGTAAKYASLPEKEENVLYWVEDEQRLYKGETLFASGSTATALLAGLMDAEDKVKLDKLRGGHSIPEKVNSHLHYILYDTYDYADGYKFMERFLPQFACSSLRKGGIVGRDLDWSYTDAANFVVETKASNGRHATIGCALAGASLAESVVESGAEIEDYKWLPFMVNDVLNDHGVYANMNVVYPGDRGYTTGTSAGSTKLCQLMIPRYVADYADSARHALELLSAVDIYAPLAGIGKECHVMLCDECDSYIVEFIDNAMTVYSNTDTRYAPIVNDMCLMTNFYLHGWNGEIKAVYSGATAEDVEQTGINAHAMGLERYKILADRYDSLNSVDDVCDAMQAVRYMKTYDLSQTPYWYSEFTGFTQAFGDLTVYNTAEDYAGIIAYTQEAYRRFERDGSLWITAHTSVYDLEQRKLYVYAEEDYEHRYEFKLNSPGVPDDCEWGSF